MDSGFWKLNPGAYYQEGWLATGNDKHIVGVTFTASHCKKHFDWPLRSNFNLRNHQHKVRFAVVYYGQHVAVFFIALLLACLLARLTDC